MGSSPLRSPALHFLLIGGLCFAVRSWRHPLSLPRMARPAEAREIVISATQVAELRRGWMQQTGRPPTEAEERDLLDQALDDEILYREAITHGFDRNNLVVRRRLIELARLLSDEPGQDDDSLVREARELGLDRSDLVVRRSLIETMRLFERQPSMPQPITDAELEELLERDADRFRTPRAVTLTQVYLSASRRGSALERDAAELLAKLHSKHVPPEAAPPLGDPFPLGSRWNHASNLDLQKAFGAAFPAALADLEPGEWAGPVRSSFGEHLVWIHERFPPTLPPLDAVRRRLVAELREKRAEERLRQRLAALRAEYSTRIETPGSADLGPERAVSKQSVPDLPEPRRRGVLGD